MKCIFKILFFLCTISIVFAQQRDADLLLHKTILAQSNAYKKNIYFKKATHFFVAKAYDSCLVYTMRYFNKNRNENLDAYAHFMRARSFHELKLYEEAKKELYKIPKSFLLYPNVLFALGNTALEQADFKKAITYFQTIEYATTNRYVHKGKLWNNIGTCFLHTNQFDKAEKYLLQANKIAESENDTLFTYKVYSNIATLYYQQYKDAQAIIYFKKAYDLSKKSNNFKNKSQAARNMAVVEENRNDFKTAMQYRKEYDVWKDSLNDQNKVWAIADLEKKFAVKQKQKEIDLLEIKNKIRATQRNTFISISALLLVLIVVGFYFYKQKVKANKTINAQKMALDELNDTKDKLFSIVSHDLRSSVNALKTSNLKLLNSLEQKNYTTLDTLLHKNTTIANGAFNLLDNLLNWAQQQTNQLFFQKENLHLHSILQQTLYNYKPLLFDKNISLSCDIPKDVYVYMDSESLKIILRNILDNAIKFSKEKDTIVIYGEETEKGYYNLIVKDTGIGMTDDMAAILMRDDIVLSKKTNKDIIGTGLGMQVCKSMLQKNDGKLYIESQMGKGTKMILCLPKAIQNG
jgi:signal transduction histidine kinase